MKKNSSTKDLQLSGNERLYIKKNHKSLLDFPLIKNFSSKYVNFYSFHVGFKKKRNDLLFVVFAQAVNVASVYSKTSTPSAPIVWDKKNNKGLCRVLIINAGNANAHTGSKGLKTVDEYTKKAASFFNCSLSEVLV
jgi:glutamate N-acetyltransferase/amino-acid N-acetyltransferase